MSKTMMEELLEQKLIVIAALDQKPFGNIGATGAVSTFCPLVPLMSARGDVFDSAALQQTFPNRGRLWWKLRNEFTTRDLLPGTVVSGVIELSDRFRFVGENKDQYQLAMASAQIGVRNSVEWIRLPAPAEDPFEALSQRGFTFPHRPLASVVISAGDWLLGPLHASYDGEHRKATLEPFEAAAPKAWKIKVTELEVGRDFHDFRFVANRWAKEIAEEPVHIVLLTPAGLQKIETEGTVVDASTDDQVMQWAMELSPLTNEERQSFQAALRKLAQPAESAEAENPERARRFHLLVQSSERILALGEQVARSLAERSDDLHRVVERHADKIADQEVSRLVERRRAEIEQQTASNSQILERVREQLASLETEYEKRRSEQDQLLREDANRQAKVIEQKEQELLRKLDQVRAETTHLDQREGEARERLQNLIVEYEVRGEEIANDILTQLPVIKYLNRASAGDGSRAAVETAAPPPLSLPAYLRQQVVHGGLNEQSFLAQFRDVVERRGFVFSEIDLINFHVCVKIGMWTALGGQSGMGKSSLVRLYAEALGAQREYRLVRVQPEWTRESDVFGRWSDTLKHFEPGTCGLLETLIAAQEDMRTGRGGIYPVCLDEMNLAGSQHYLARFLSLLEEPAAARVIELFPAGLEQPADPYTPFRRIRLGDNLRFIGTVNSDEPTHFFGAKVLDRGPNLRLDFASLQEGLEKRSTAEELAGLRPVHLSEYQQWIQDPVKDPVAMQTLVAIDQELRLCSLSLGFRVRDRVLRYLASAALLLDKDRALDLSIAHSAMPRLCARAARIHECLDRLSRLLPADRFPRSNFVLRGLQQSKGEHDFFRAR